MDWRKGRTPAAHCFTVEGLSQHRKPLVSEDEQAILKQVSLRPIEPEERDRFDELICREHYLHLSDLVGEQRRYVAEYRGQWVALLAWSAAAFHLKDREVWIGWTGRPKRRRLTLGVNNSQFLIRTEGRLPNLASRVMKLCLQRLSADWLRVYGHEVLELCPVPAFQWGQASVPLQVLVMRETYADGHQDGWALLSTEALTDPQRPPRDYARRTTIEERHRQLKCFHDLTDFHSCRFQVVVAQVVFVLLSYTLRQWQLWKTQHEELAGWHPDRIQRRLNLEHQFAVIYHQRAYVQLPLVTFTREVLELEPAARDQTLAKIRRLEQSFLTPLRNLRPPRDLPAPGDPVGSFGTAPG